jgi:hypothetical protein
VLSTRLFAVVAPIKHFHYMLEERSFTIFMGRKLLVGAICWRSLGSMDRLPAARPVIHRQVLAYYSPHCRPVQPGGEYSLQAGWGLLSITDSSLTRGGIRATAHCDLRMAAEGWTEAKMPLSHRSPLLPPTQDEYQQW